MATENEPNYGLTPLPLTLTALARLKLAHGWAECKNLLVAGKKAMVMHA